MEKFQDFNISQLFKSYPKDIRKQLLKIRTLIFNTAKKIPEVGPIEETLRWNQPSYIPSQSKSGSLIRIDQIKSKKDTFAIYFHCQTSLIKTFRATYPHDFQYEKNRAIIFNTKDLIPWEKLKNCIELALTYNL